MTIPRDPEKAKALGEMNEQEEQEIEDIAQIVHKTLSFDIGPVNDADRKDAREILSLIERTHVRKDTEVKVRCRDVATYICDYCIKGKQSCEGRANGGYITRTVGELVGGGK